MKKLIIALLAFIVMNPLFAASPSPADAQLYFISPAEGARVQNPVVVRFGLKNMGVAPAGINLKNTGHHHLIIDSELPALDKPIPNDDKHRHFGMGQTETAVELAPGKHTLQLLLGDFSHTPHQKPVISQKITITVE